VSATAISSPGRRSVTASRDTFAIARTAAFEIEAEGPHDELQRFLDLLRSGHPLAEVERVDVAWDTFRGEFAGWDLRW